jgi:hypothetical protein
MKKLTHGQSIVGALIVSGITLTSWSASAQQQAVPKDKIETMTVTGCLATGASGSDFVLNNAKAEAVASTSPNIMHSPPAVDMNKDDKPVSYVVKGGDVQAHVGHKVTITGTMDDVKPSTTGAVGTAGTTTDTPAAAKADAMKTLNVKSVKMVAANCS